MNIFQLFAGPLFIALCGIGVASCAERAGDPAAAVTDAGEQAPPLAFPGAEGYGKHTVGGRSGRVVHVTNLDASGEGSFAWAVNEINEPRIIVFDVAGVIDCENKVGFRIGRDNGHVTIAGETSPGGIAVYNYRYFTIGGSNKRHNGELMGEQVIMRFLRFRSPTINLKDGHEPDGLLVWNATDVIVDHCSFAGACDETTSLYGIAGNVTMQWIGHDESRHAKAHHDFFDNEGQWHNYGGLWSPRGGPATCHHSFFAHHGKRCLLTGGDQVVESINNVIYNYSNGQQTYAAAGANQKVVNCYFKLGADRRERGFGPRPVKDDVAVVSGCISVERDGSEGPPAPDRGELGELSVDALESAEEAFESVLAGAGALPHDATSQRMVEEIREGTGRQGYTPRQQEDAAALVAYPTPADGDGDGMPDAWEAARGLDVDDPADATQLAESGYTNLETYCHYLAERLIAGELPWKDDPEVLGGPAR